MAELYTLRHDGKTFGPFSQQEISELLQNGSISRQTEASPVDADDWRPLEQWNLNLTPSYTPQSHGQNSSQPYSPAPTTPYYQGPNNSWSRENQQPSEQYPNSPPPGVMVIGVIYALGALGMFLGMLAAFFIQRLVPTIPGATGESAPMIATIMSGLGAFLGILMMVLFFLCGFVAYGMFTLRNSARITAMVLSVLNLLGQLQSCTLINGQNAARVVIILLLQTTFSIWVIFYLTQGRIKNHFI